MASSKIQNEIIISCLVIKQTIAKEVNNAWIFSIMADETKDISTKEQVAVSERYVDSENENKEID